MILLVAAAAPRVVLATRSGLWVDEVFSLAMATGHSLEHPAADARPALGDFVEPRDVVSPPAFGFYTQHDGTWTGEPRRVVRAVFLSDTSPPLYYLLLSGWTRSFGTGDAALRLFSAACALACLPLLWLIGRRVGGPSTAWIACVLFAVSPLAVYYSAEGRMYALTWLFSLLLAWASLALEQRGPHPLLLLLWIGAGTAGLLTHYFFAFVWFAAAVWLWMNNGKMLRTHTVAAVAATGLLVLPWYLQVPDSLHHWRVTGGWLNQKLTREQIITRPPVLVWSMFSGDFLGRSSMRGPWLAGALYALLIVVAVRRGLSRLFSPQRTLLWLWLAAAVTGPVAFDVLRATHASLISRYALPALPAAILILALGIALVPNAARVAFLVLLLAAWSSALRDAFSRPSRPWEPFPVIADDLADWTRAAPQPNSDIAIVQSIPSGVIGLARYLRAPIPLASWVVQLGQRSGGADMRMLTAGYCRVVLVKVHYLGLPSPPQLWLRENAILERLDRISPEAEIRYYAMHSPSDTTRSAAHCATAQTLASPAQHVLGAESTRGGD